MEKIERLKNDIHEYAELMNHETFKEAKNSYILNHIFYITTYDSLLDEKFVNDILEIMDIILKRKNFEYIKDETNYIKFITIVNLIIETLDWGTSIRGCFFNKITVNCFLIKKELDDTIVFNNYDEIKELLDYLKKEDE